MAKLAGNFVAAPLNAAVNTTQELHQKSKAFKDMLDIVGPRGHDFKPNSSILKSVGGDHVTKYCKAVFVFIQFVINGYVHSSYTTNSQ